MTEREKNAVLALVQCAYFLAVAEAQDKEQGEYRRFLEAQDEFVNAVAAAEYQS